MIPIDKIVYARPSGVNYAVYKWHLSAEQISIRINGANRKASLMNGDFLPMVPLVRIS